GHMAGLAAGQWVYSAPAASPWRSGMGENVLFRPAGEVEFRPRRQETEAGLRDIQAVLAAQAGLQAGLDGMEMKHVGSRIFELRLAEHGAAPVGGLLLL